MNEKLGNLSATKLDRQGRPQYKEHFPCFFFRENKVARNTSKRVLYSLKVTICFCQSFESEAKTKIQNRQSRKKKLNLPLSLK